LPKFLTEHIYSGAETIGWDRNDLAGGFALALHGGAGTLRHGEMTAETKAGWIARSLDANLKMRGIAEGLENCLSRLAVP